MNTPAVDRTQLNIAGVAVGVLVLVALFAVTAALVSGALSAGVFVVGVLAGAGVPVAVLWGLRDATPASGAVGTGMAILAQLTYGQSAIVRDEHGGYHWRLLRGDGADWYVQLEDGTEVPVDAVDADLYRFGLGDLAITEQKTQTNMHRFTVDDNGVHDESTREVRAGYKIHHPDQKQRGSWLVSLKFIQALTDNTADPDVVRQAREKALEEAGGTQQISGLVTMLLASGLMVGGFVLGFAALTL